MLFSYSLSSFRCWSSLAALVVLLFGASLLSVSSARADDDDSAVANDDDSSSGGWSQGAAQAAGDLSGCSCGESIVGMNSSKPSPAALLALTLVFVAMRRRRCSELL